MWTLVVIVVACNSITCMKHKSTHEFTYEDTRLSKLSAENDCARASFQAQQDESQNGLVVAYCVKGEV